MCLAEALVWGIAAGMVLVGLGVWWTGDPNRFKED